MMKNTKHRTWAEIDLDALENNYRTIRSRLRHGCMLLATAKADCYGHGAARCAEVLQRLGADFFSAATFDEALHLRENGIIKPILILGYTDPENAGELAEMDVRQAVFSGGYARALAESLGNKKLKIHIKLDTGMGRLGFDPGNDKALREIAEICKMPCFEPEGIFTHFSVADEPGQAEYTMSQFKRYQRAVHILEEELGVKFSIHHCANSAAMVNYPETQLDMVRAGISLYGAYPDGAEEGELGLKPVMTLRCRIAQVQDAREEKSVSYGRTKTVPAGTRLAVMTCGYADGLHRCASNKFSVKVRGKLVPNVGRVCMDMSMLDVTGVDVHPGDVVTIFGGSGEDHISIEQLAKASGTVSYELLCSVSKRIPRIYIGGKS